VRYVYQTVIGTTGGPLGNGISTAVPVDTLLNPFSVGVGCTITSGTATYTVQHCFDDVFNPNFNPGTAIWINHPSLVNQTTSIDGNYAFPVRAIRLVVNSGTGTVTMAVGQAGI